MIDILPLTPEYFDELKPLYASFSKAAQAEYSWPHDPIQFDALCKIVNNRLMHGYVIKNVVENRGLGFMLYSVESFRALEIKVIYLEPGVSEKIALDYLFNRFIEDIKTVDGWDVVSFPVLGPGQRRYIHFLPWYGFKLVGQAVVKFNIFDGISVEIFKKQQFAPLPEGYEITSWEPRYEEGVIDVLAESFADSVDALWDPRFRTREGVKEAMSFVKNGGYGLFWPSCYSILLNAEKKPVGVCLLNIVSPEEANIPLIGLLNSERRHKLGRTLLASTVDKCLGEVLKGKLRITNISATVATGNIPAIKMYRYTAFQEDHWYPHAYQERSSVLTRKPGKWC